MASSIQCSLLLSLFFFATVAPSFQQSFRPKALVLPVSKDASTLQYVTRISQRTPLVPVALVVDLGGQFLWVDCEQNYVSSTYLPARCGSAVCSLARASGCGDCFSAARPGCNNNTCEVATDLVSVNSTDGSNPGQAVNVTRFVFACAPSFLLDGLASGVQGMAGLGRTRIALPSQFASAFSFNRKFAICLSSSPSSNGVIFFGDSPYNFLPNINVSQSLAYTPLYINPVSTASAYSQGEPSSEYFIKVTAITVGDITLSLNSTLLSIDSEGYGGTKISTVNPYTVLESSIYASLTEAFVKEATSINITRVSAVSPFEYCFNSSSIGVTRVGAAVPYIFLVLQGEEAVWTITGSNSMVEVSQDVLCLGFVDGGSRPRTSIVIGGYQLQDNLVQFDLARSRLGFSSTLLGRRTTCANFNFTSNA
ncbi:hypothetical protein EUGRSUZ_K03382 [Eucalyptus grandis]|uniref:Uncharacterized protein n=2 Tax=Eucalyptus grandis TaxID=71139 RepID=A0ACC3J0F3_EUCGR|nr:hypothetical protein EUGRSUZ_K03382 [Eucalyptus grandis]